MGFTISANLRDLVNFDGLNMDQNCCGSSQAWENCLKLIKRVDSGKIVLISLNILVTLVTILS